MQIKLHLKCGLEEAGNAMERPMIGKLVRIGAYGVALEALKGNPIIN